MSPNSTGDTPPTCFDCAGAATERLDEMFVGMVQARRLALGQKPAAALDRAGFGPAGGAGFCAAHSTTLLPPASPGWLAVGDAALGFDPLSSQGLFNALYTGLAGAAAADRHLHGDATALPDYAARLRPIGDAYRSHLRAWYGAERRWSQQPFWQRRQTQEPAESEHLKGRLLCLED
jgi:2-polyprenyl-6-methoxyphenol hydroxylase-like FAD-dependent oxidoreductase